MAQVEDFVKLKERFDEARNYKDRWLALYKNLYLYVIPDRDAFNIKFNYRDDGIPLTQNVWDNTAVLAAYQRANDLHGLLLPQDRVWGKMTLDKNMYEPALIERSKPLMDEINERIFFFLNQSNLARVVSSSNLDLVGGTAAIWVESRDDRTPLYFRSIPAVALYIEYSTDDVINTCWYAMKQTGRQVMESFPDYRGPLLETLQALPNTTYTVNYGQIRLSDNRYYIYVVLDSDPYHPCYERISNYPQIIIYRDKVRPGEAEGRGVGLDMLPMIMDLNRIAMYRTKSMAFKAFPPLFYDADKYMNPYAIRQWAGAMIARNPQGRNPVQAMDMPHTPEVLETIRDFRDFIRVGFQVDPLGEITSPVRSATEVSVREARAQRTSATDISRLINELPRQVYEVASIILNERGLLVKKRNEIPGFNPKLLKFVFQSPLTDLQNQADLNHFATNMQFKQQYMGEGAALMSLNMGEVNDFLTEKTNLPAKLFVDKATIQKYLAALADRTQNQQLPLPSPSTTAAPAKFPEGPGVTI